LRVVCACRACDAMGISVIFQAVAWDKWQNSLTGAFSPFEQNLNKHYEFSPCPQETASDDAI
jgi:hypothetical protein